MPRALAILTMHIAYKKKTQIMDNLTGHFNATIPTPGVGSAETTSSEYTPRFVPWKSSSARGIYQLLHKRANTCLSGIVKLQYLFDALPR